MDQGRIDAAVGEPGLGGVDHRRRAAQIDIVAVGDVEAQQPGDMADSAMPAVAALDHRELGGQVEDNEAEWLLDVLEGLFDFYFVQPQRSKAKRDALDKKLKDTGKPQLKSVPAAQAAATTK